MRYVLRSSICGLIFVIVVTQPAGADEEQCRQAVDRYNSALADVSYALRRYASCVSDSKGNDDCSSEFRRLRSAQDDFKSAVSEYRSECS